MIKYNADLSMSTWESSRNIEAEQELVIDAIYSVLQLDDLIFWEIC